MEATPLAVRDEPNVPVLTTPMDMLANAVERGMSVEVIDKLMALEERWNANKGRRAFDQAIAEAKAEIPVISKNREVDFTSSKGRTHYRYEDLAEVSRTVTPILAKHGLSFRYRTTSPPNEPVTVTCIISHRDGHFEENTLSAGRDDSGNKNPIQAIGSTVTYLQRMTLKAALGLAASEDDDARASAVDGPITDDQAKTIRNAIAETEADEGVFLKYIGGFDSVEDIPASQYQRAIAALGAKRRQAKKQAEPA